MLVSKLRAFLLTTPFFSRELIQRRRRTGHDAVKVDRSRPRPGGGGRAGRGQVGRAVLVAAVAAHLDQVRRWLLALGLRVVGPDLVDAGGERRRRLGLRPLGEAVVDVAAALAAALAAAGAAAQQLLVQSGRHALLL